LIFSFDRFDKERNLLDMKIIVYIIADYFGMLAICFEDNNK